MSVKLSFKAQNIPLIILFLLWGITIYILFITGLEDFSSDLMSLFEELNAKEGFLVTIAPLLSFVTVHIIDSNTKAVLVFWKFRDPLPGSRAFSEIGPRDPRVDMRVLRERLGYIPTTPIEQNKLWYKIYKQVEGTISVDSSHKNFLLARDLATISFLFLILTTLPVLIIRHNIMITFAYVLIWVFHYLVLCIVAQNTGQRFVSNVLATYCCMEPQKELPLNL